jgi:hypothetical protein
MADFPYHVVGGVIGNFGASRPAFVGTLGSYPSNRPLVETEARTGGSRRRRLWELPHKFHCPLIGVSFACDELRALMSKVMHFPPDAADFVLHTTAVAACEQRSRLAELLQKTLEARCRLAVKAVARLKKADELGAVWRRACSEGADIPATLWACWTHPAIDAALEQEIFADIHMLQHQLGTGTRADLAAMRALKEENAELRRQLAAANAAAGTLRVDKVDALQAAADETAAVRAELAATEARAERLQREVGELRAALPELGERQVLARRLAAAEAAAVVSRQHADALDKEAARLRVLLRSAEETIAALGRDEAILADFNDSQLCGKRVLCVGGRSGAVNSYREVVEQSGGRFLHHDGGLEENLHRIDNVVAAADIVICQAGCISHNAYWRVKEQCKRTGKPCLFVKNAGVASFGRAVEVAGRQEVGVVETL